jgi:hypothetical protein
MSRPCRSGNIDASEQNQRRRLMILAEQNWVGE